MNQGQYAGRKMVHSLTSAPPGTNTLHDLSPLQVVGMVGTVEYAIAEDRLDADGELWVPDEADPAEGRECSAPFHVTPYAGVSGLSLT